MKRACAFTREIGSLPMRPIQGTGASGGGVLEQYQNNIVNQWIIVARSKQHTWAVAPVIGRKETKPLRLDGLRFLSATTQRRRSSSKPL
mmetsp:Transcript_15953/g.36605  ORF Transcript_15953/g.36605 Transcript_15953/m.36605 type:complete len:89 (+) Transcript_15953:541-807(+)